MCECVCALPFTDSSPSDQQSFDGQKTFSKMEKKKVVEVETIFDGGEEDLETEIATSRRRVDVARVCVVKI